MFLKLVQNTTQQIQVTPCHCFCNEFKVVGTGTALEQDFGDKTQSADIIC